MSRQVAPPPPPPPRPPPPPPPPPPPAAASHLALLEVANLVSTVWRGREKLHYLNPVPLQEIYERWIGKYEGEGHRLQALSDLKKSLEENKG